MSYTSHEYGYGVWLDDNVLKPEAYKGIIGLMSDDIFKHYKAFCESCKDEYDSEGKMFDAFIDDWDSDHCGGIYSLLAACINGSENLKQEKGCRFTGDEYHCIYVSAEVPKTQAHRDALLTQDRIKKLLTDYLEPLFEKALTFETVEFDY